MALFRRKKKPEPAPSAPQVEISLPQRPPIDVNGMRSVQAHRDYVLSLVEQLPAFGQYLLEAQGLSLCEDLVADLSLPRFDNSAMDGYAVRSEDLTGCSRDNPVRLPVVGTVHAGDPGDIEVGPGQAVKIMTGAPVPDGLDAVVKYEDTDRGVDIATFLVEPRLGANIRQVGEDITLGDQIASVGDRITPRHIGMLAGVGIEQVLVRPRPRVVVFSTGAELAPPGADLRPGQIYDSNSYLLAALAAQAGAQVYRVGSVSDDPQEVAAAISDQQVRADLIITSGGVSQGDHDVIKHAAPLLGPTDFSRVAMQPGKPQGVALIGEEPTPMIMLPGNPVSSFVSFEVFVRPVLRKMMGITPVLRPTVTAVAEAAMTSRRGMTQFQRGIVTTDDEGTRRVTSMGTGGSHKLGDLARSNALVVLPPEVERVDPGETVEVLMVEED